MAKLTPTIPPLSRIAANCLSVRFRECGLMQFRTADRGYFSRANVEACEKAGIEPLTAIGRQPHHPPLQERFETLPPAENPTPVEAMAHRLKMPEGSETH